MGQIQNVGLPGITVTPIDRETGPGAGPGTSGNRDIYLGLGSATNSTLDDSIVLGNNAGSGGMADANLRGTIIIGSQAAPALIHAQGAPDSNSGNILIGYEVATNLQYGNASVIVGDRAFFSAVGALGAAMQDNVIVGARAHEFPTGRTNEAVIIGYKAARGPFFGGSASAFNASVIVGSNACANASAANISGCVVMGYTAGNAMGTGGGSCSNHVVIGTAAAPNLFQGTDIVAIGAGVLLSGNPTGVTVIGTGAATNGNFITVVGAQAGQFGGGNAGPHCIVMGANAGAPGAGNSPANNSQNLLVLESYDNLTATRRTGLFANMDTGQTVLGNSGALDRGFGGSPGTNLIKLLNSDLVAAPAGVTDGGFFYVASGQLHWVGSAGTDTVLAPP